MGYGDEKVIVDVKDINNGEILYKIGRASCRERV